MVGHEVDRANPEGGNSVAAVHPLAKAEETARGGDLRPPFEGLGPHYRGQDLELRKIYAEIAAKEPRPGAPGEDDRIASDPPPFGNYRRHPAGRRLEAAHGATRNDRGTRPPRRLGDRWRRPLRLGLAVAGGVESAGPGAGQTRHQLRRFASVDDAGVELILAGMMEPGFKLAELGLRLGQIHDPGLAKAGLGFDQLVHSLPQPQALDDQRELAGIAPHLATPAPVAARLLAGDVPLFAEDDANALLCEEQSGAGTDDPAADDHDIGARRQH